MKNAKPICKDIVFILIALCIPGLLALQSLQGYRYVQLENQLKNLEKKQSDLIESNKQLISDIGLLSSSARIEKIAVEELGMHQASSEEIDRVQIKRLTDKKAGHTDAR
ncbi:cell division protein FtsL [Treponema sp. OMZ 840]|uniref:septum formation initiator family protein n=1 Tax=Treponema sp. OMZ 840 TaxID=244313 RepID=UPI003D8FE6BD